MQAGAVDLPIMLLDRPRARRSDPTTSHVAANQSKRFASSQAGRILSALKIHGPISARSVGFLTGLTVVQVDRRLPELRAQGLARVQQDEAGDVVRDGCRVWEAV